MKAMKEQMTTMMEAMMSMKKIMEVNVVVVASTSVVAEVDPTPPSGLSQINHPTSNMIGQGGKELGSMGPPFCASSEQACLPAIWLASQSYTTQCCTRS